MYDNRSLFHKWRKVQAYKHDGTLHRQWSPAFVVQENEDCWVLASKASLVTEADGNGYRYSKKFADNASKQDWLPLIRFAETKLNLAECYANKADGTAQAKANLKDVRRRSISAADDVIDLDALSGGNLTSAIYNERRLEFICEGIRGIDIIRRGESFVKKNSVVDLNIDPTNSYYIWPITNTEKQFNKTLND